MFADDTQLINKTEEYIEEAFKTLEIYEKASGAKKNLEKTVGMYLGKWRNKNPRSKNIKWSKKPVKALGVFHGYAIGGLEIKRSYVFWKNFNYQIICLIGNRL